MHIAFDALGPLEHTLSKNCSFLFRASLNTLSKTVLVLTLTSTFLGNIIYIYILFSKKKNLLYIKRFHIYKAGLLVGIKMLLVIFFKRNWHILAEEWNSIISFRQTINIPSSIIKLSKK